MITKEVTGNSIESGPECGREENLDIIKLSRLLELFPFYKLHYTLLCVSPLLQQLKYTSRAKIPKFVCPSLVDFALL